jgi:cobalt ECF transporter T component CbiQ
VRASALLLGGGGTPEGFLAGLDARAKLLGVLSLLVASTLASRPESLAAAAGAAWVVALAGGVSPRRLFLILSFVPLFGLALALPAALSPVTPGQPLLVLLRYPSGSWGPWRWPADLSITAGGLYVALRLLLRTAACLSLAALLTASTPAPALWRALRGLGAPAVFSMTAGMMARYLELLLRAAEEVHLAKISRGGARGAGFERAWAAASLGEIYQKTRRLADEVTRAMVSRGFTGEARLLQDGRFGAGEVLFLLASLAGAVALALG